MVEKQTIHWIFCPADRCCWQKWKTWGNFYFSFMMNYLLSQQLYLMVRDEYKSLMTKTVYLYLMHVRPSSPKSGSWWLCFGKMLKHQALPAVSQEEMLTGGERRCRCLWAWAARWEGGLPCHRTTCPEPEPRGAVSAVPPKQKPCVDESPATPFVGSTALQVVLPLSVQKPWN